MGVTGQHRGGKRSERPGVFPLDSYSLVALAAGLSVTASFVWDRFVSMDGPAWCPFRRATGVPCPACGLTRSFVSMGNLDVATAWAMHAIGPLLWVVFALIGVHGAIEVLARRRLRPAWFERWRGRLGAALFALVVGWGLVRAAGVVLG